MNARWAGLAGALVIAGGLAAAAAAAGQKPAAGVPNLSGHWRLNKQLSDDEAAKLAAASGKGAAKQAPAKAEGVREGAPPGAGDKGSTTDDDPRGAQRKPEAMADITVSQSDVEIAVVDTTGQTRSFYPNGRTYKADEGASTVRSAWKDAALAFEKKNVRGWRLSESWHLEPDGARLHFDSRFEGGGRPTVVVKRVYDRVSEGK